MRRRLQLLELAAPRRPVTGGDFYLLQDLRFGLGDERPDIPAAHIGADDNAPLAILPADLVRSRRQLQTRDFAKRDIGGTAISFGARQRNRQAFDGFQVVAQVFRQPDDDVEAAVALEQCAGLFAPDGGGNGVLHIRDIQAVTRGLVPVDVDCQHRQPGGLLHLDFGGAGDFPQHG